MKDKGLKSLRSAVCLIVKDEVLDITGWVLHHKAIGFDDVIIYDNESSDGTTEVLRHLSEEVGIRHVPWPSDASSTLTQGRAYENCFAASAGVHDWVAVLDSDEYLVADHGLLVNDFLNRFPDAGAVALNWMIFGSGGVIDGSDEDTLAGFLYRAPEMFGGNAHTKCFLRPEEFISSSNPHSFRTIRPCVNVLGEPIAWSPETGEGCVPEDAIVHGDMRLHHYFIRSRLHWERRIRRGLWGNPQRAEAEFEAHDRNEVFDPSGVAHAARLALHRSRLRCEPEVRALVAQWRAGEDYAAVRVSADGYAATLKATEQVPAELSDYKCCIDGLEAAAIMGWAARLGDSLPATLDVQVDDRPVRRITCDVERSDVRAAGLASTTAGFRIDLPETLQDGQEHRLSLHDAAGRVVEMHVHGMSCRRWAFVAPRAPVARGRVDLIEQGCFRGWVLRRHPTGEWHGGSQVEIRTNGVRVTTTRANRGRPDVARSQGSDIFCGFEVQVPLAFRRTGVQTFRALVMPEEVELEGSPFSATIVTDTSQVVIADLADSVERLFKEIVSVRQTIRQLRQEERHTIDAYDRWYRSYRDTLRARLRQARGEAWPGRDREAPLVSVVVPTYRPRLDHFALAIESVRAQTHEAWELLVVDDNSASPELTRYLDELRAEDGRVRVFALEENAGISGATNRALREARGDWIVFFDHDDLLDEVALEVMLGAAQATGARLLYSDEDKVDDAGHFSEPALKPDFNPRLLRACNYICHLVMVAAPTVRAVGPLLPEFNGAQDFDFLLRVVEHLPEQEILHVREILYHWRKTANSTATDVSAKPYAIEAGRRAVAAHLQRSGLSGAVSPIGLSTLYRIEWERPQREPSVLIIVPFRDQAASTRRCLDAVLTVTAYRNFEVVLVDNWSCTREAEELVAYANTRPNVRTMRVEEEFNYSRLNNLAAASSDAELFLLLNNDLFVEGADWLHVLVGELLADDRAGAVGGRFLYPNHTIQHAGVVIGLAGVAGHTYAGRPSDYAGYLGRAMVAQNLSAVTAACMLVRGSAWRAIGGLDEKHLRVAFNDVDLCLRLVEAGYRIVWTPDFTAEHHESLSRGSDDRPDVEARFFDEILYMQTRWEHVLHSDPAYSRFFSLEREAFHDLQSPGADTQPILQPSFNQAAAPAGD